MLIAALDSTTRAGSVALWRDGWIAERSGDPARTHAERLPDDLASLLADHGATVADVERYAVASGPGSFTGMRVGIATIQTLALVHDRLIVPVPALEALAHEAALAPGVGTGSFCGGWMEAYRGEIFAALYRVAEPAAPGAAGQVERGSARLELVRGPSVGAAELLAREWAAAAGSGAVYVAGDGLSRTVGVLAGHFAERVTALPDRPLAGTIAALAARHPERAVRPHAVVPLYVRRPDAELARSAQPAVPS